MLINLRNALMGGKRLPYDAEVEYLESTGTQWIDTGVKLTNADIIRIGFEITSSTYAAIFGAGNADGNSGVDYSVYLQNRASLVFQCTLATGNASAPYTINTRYDMEATVSTGEMSVNGISYSATNFRPLVASNYNLFLFARNLAGSADRKGMLRVYSFSIERNGVLVRDFIPVRVGTVGYLYDRVSGKLFGNAGTGAFTYGNDLKYPIPA